MRKVRWGVLGTADIAWGQTIPGMQQAENCELWAIAGRRLEKAQRYQERFGFAKAYEGYEALLEDPQVEAVYVPLPNNLHAEWCVRALRAGKHVLCEKPLAVSEKQAGEMFRAAEEGGTILMEAFAYLHSPFIAAVRAEVESGVIGEIRYMESAFITTRRPASDIRLRKETYGGALYDLGCYATSMVLRMMGREPEAAAAAANFSESGVDLNTTAVLSFPGGAAANVACGMQLPRGRLDRFRLHGSLGEIVSPVEFNQCGRIPYTVVRDGETRTETVDAPNNYTLEVEQMGRCILDGEKPLISKAFSLANARVLDRILEAIGY